MKRISKKACANNIRKKTKGYPCSKCLTCMDAVLIEAWHSEQGEHSEAFCGITGQKIDLDAVIKKCNRYDSVPEEPR